MSNIRVAFLNIRKNIRNEKELKSSFIITIFGMALNNIAFLYLWYSFGKIMGELNGWKPMDIFGLYAFGGMSFGFINGLFYGIYNIPSYIRSGNFDKYLLTPKNILLKVSTSQISTSAFGDLLFGIVCFIIFALNYKLSFTNLLLCLIIFIFTSLVLYSFSLICMSISFYLMDGENVSTGLYGMFISNSLYHGGAYTGILRVIFIFIIPSLLVGAIPVELLKNFTFGNLVLYVILSIFWFLVAVLFFYKSLKKYESNNLFGFGN